MMISAKRGCPAANGEMPPSPEEELLETYNSELFIDANINLSVL